MSARIILERLASYQCQSVQEEEQAIREITQEIALLSLSRTDFFKKAAFHGGTCLRVLYGLSRFSEDLDFLLQEPEREFLWERFLRNLTLDFKVYGYDMEVTDRSHVEGAMKTAFTKDDSVGQVLSLRESGQGGRRKKITIKLEIDTNPPSGSSWETRYLDYPLPFAVVTQDLASSFSLKNHALLCRAYTKGRDWYDLVWYVGRKTPINFDLLSNALDQAGPWQAEHLRVSKEWYLSHLQAKIKAVDWHVTRQDVARFLKPSELSVLDLWNEQFFLRYVEKLDTYLEEDCRRLGND